MKALKQHWLGIVLIFAFVVSGCEKSQEPKSPNGAKQPQTSVAAPVDYLGAVAKARKSAERTVDLASLNRAIQSFHAMEDRYPKDLQELVQQHYLASLPIAPTGMRIVYDATRGEARIIKQ